MAHQLHSVAATSSPLQPETENAFLRKLGSVVRLSPEDRRALLSACSDVRQVPAHRYIARQGDKPSHVHLILDGWAARCELVIDGSRQITAFLLPGDLCDQHVTILGKMDHNIWTITATSVAYLHNGELEAIARTHPEIARALWWSTLVDESVLRAWLCNLGRREAYERIGHLLCELHLRMQNVGLAEDTFFELPVTQEDLADALGLTPVHVNRMLQRLRREGLITLDRRKLVIHNPARLREAASFNPTYLHHQLARTESEGPGGG